MEYKTLLSISHNTTISFVCSSKSGRRGKKSSEKVHMHPKILPSAFANKTAMHDEVCTKGFNECITPINIKFAKREQACTETQF